MTRFVSILYAGTIAAAVAGGTAFMPTPAEAASEADKAAQREATATCRARVNEQAQFHEMSLYAKHKAVKECIKETLAHH